MSSEENTTLQAAAIVEIFQDPKASSIGAIFLNRKSLEVRYYFENKGTKELIMINVDSLGPIFGGFCPTACGCFETLDKLSAFVQQNIHFNQCSGYQYAECLCHLLEDHLDPELEMFPTSDYPLRHFHHACCACENRWLNEYLRVLILHRESKLLFDEATAEIFCSRLHLTDDFDEFFNRECPEFYLRIAQRWTISEYLLDNDIDTRL